MFTETAAPPASSVLSFSEITVIIPSSGAMSHPSTTNPNTTPVQSGFPFPSLHNIPGSTDSSNTVLSTSSTNPSSILPSDAQSGFAPIIFTTNQPQGSGATAIPSFSTAQNTFEETSSPSHMGGNMPFSFLDSESNSSIQASPTESISDDSDTLVSLHFIEVRLHWLAADQHSLVVYVYQSTLTDSSFLWTTVTSIETLEDGSRSTTIVVMSRVCIRI